jgi:hypothetical protein
MEIGESFSDPRSLTPGYWLATGYWLLATGYWPLAIDHCFICNP